MQTRPTTSSRQPGLSVTAVILVTICAALLSCTSTAPAGTPLTEASGLFFQNDTLWIVSDDAPGTVFVYPLAGIPKSGVIPIDTAKLLRRTIPGGKFVSDLESIDRQPDGDFLILSEDLHALCRVETRGSDSQCVLATQFDQTVTELGNRGLEGAAVRTLGDERMLLAVAWEGGYLEFFSIPPQLRNAIGHLALEPIVIIDTLSAKSRLSYLDEPAYYLTLQTPKPDSLKDRGQRFRISDLVWSGQGDSPQNNGFIALLSSADSPDIESGQRRRFQYKWLVRFDLAGSPIGSPCDITPLVKNCWEKFAATEMSLLSPSLQVNARTFGEKVAAANWENVNWEGLAWLEPGTSLVLIYDGSPIDPPFAFVIPLPEEWR